MNCNPVTLLSKKERARIANHSFNTILQAVAMQPAALVKRNFSYAAFFAIVLNICFFELLCVGTSERVLYQTLGKHLMIRNRRLLIIYRIHCTENHIFFFPDVLKRRSFQKDCAGIWSFLYYREIWYFFLPKRWSYLQMENERWSFSKKYTEIWYFLRMFWKDGLFKKTASGHDLSCTIWKVGISSRKHGIFSLDEKRERNDFSQEIHGNMIFSIWYVPHPLCHPYKNKNQRQSYLPKIHQKVTDIPDRHARKGPKNSLYLHGNLYRRFHILQFSKKNK